LVGDHRYENRSPGADNVPPAGTLPINPLDSQRDTPNPTGLMGTVPPGSGAAIIISPPTGGGLGEIDVNIEEEIQTEPPEVQEEVQEQIDKETETQVQEETNVETPPDQTE
jgi:hypothetical protein